MNIRKEHEEEWGLLIAKLVGSRMEIAIYYFCVSTDVYKIKDEVYKIKCS